MVNEELTKGVESISMERNIENLKREQGNYEKNIKFHEDLLIKLEEDEKKLIKVYDIVMSKFKIIAPVWEYEKDEEYIEIVKDNAIEKHKNDLELFNKNREQIKEVIDKQKEAYKSVTDELVRIEGEKKNE